MSSMKTLVVMALLAGAGYWMYMHLGQKSELVPADIQAAISPPTVQMPGIESPPPIQTAAPTIPSPTPIAPPTLLGGSPSAPVASTVGSSGVTLINPPSASGISNTQQGSAATSAPPSLLSATPTDQAPAASYPAIGGSSVAPMATATVGNAAMQDNYGALMDDVQKKLEQGQLAEVLSMLSTLYDNPDLPQSEARQVTELLDQLAGTVIYSRQHLLEQPYIVRPGDTLDQIAAKYNVPSILLARINGIRDLQYIEPGRELKVMRGPFSAVVHLEKHELTLMLGGRYAGRFSIGVGCDQPKLEGEYIVREKSMNPAYRGPGGIGVPGGDPRNPLGKFWIGLGDNVGLHGTVDPQNIGRDDNRGTICLDDRDIDDLYGILSVGSRVVIQR